MYLERTISQLDVGRVSPQRAADMGRLGYLQWLGALPGNRSYLGEAARALALAQPFCETSPAVAEFCRLVEWTLQNPGKPMALQVPVPRRRGGAQARRLIT